MFGVLDLVYFVIAIKIILFFSKNVSFSVFKFDDRQCTVERTDRQCTVERTHQHCTVERTDPLTVLKCTHTS